MYYAHIHCKKCGGILKFSHYTKEGNVQLVCPACLPYINVCWNCHTDVDSRINKKSPIPNMGYICGNCGKDLSEWKVAKGLISVRQYIELYYQGGSRYAVL